MLFRLCSWVCRKKKRRARFPPCLWARSRTFCSSIRCGRFSPARKPCPAASLQASPRSGNRRNWLRTIGIPTKPKFPLFCKSNRSLSCSSAYASERLESPAGENDAASLASPLGEVNALHLQLAALGAEVNLLLLPADFLVLFPQFDSVAYRHEKPPFFTLFFFLRCFSFFFLYFFILNL